MSWRGLQKKYLFSQSLLISASFLPHSAPWGREPVIAIVSGIAFVLETAPTSFQNVHFNTHHIIPLFLLSKKNCTRINGDSESNAL